MRITNIDLKLKADEIWEQKDHWTYLQGALGQLGQSERCRNLYNYYWNTQGKLGQNSMTMVYVSWLEEYGADKHCTDCCNFLNYIMEYGTSMHSAAGYANMKKCPSIAEAPIGAALTIGKSHVGLKIGPDEFQDIYAYNHTFRRGKISESMFDSAHYINGVDYCDEPSIPFIDVPIYSWSYPYIRYLYDKGIMTGFTDKLFAPINHMSRGMAATVIYRSSGADVEYEKHFPDVPDDKYYSKPVTWAFECGVIRGYESGLFGPDDNIIRQDFVVMIHRYAKACKCDVSVKSPVSYRNVPDFAQIDDYATEAMNWAYEKGFVAVGSNFHPHEEITREEAAAILARFLMFYVG